MRVFSINACLMEVSRSAVVKVVGARAKSFLILIIQTTNRL